MEKNNRKIQIGVMGSAADLLYSSNLAKLAEEVGFWIAKNNAVLMFGAEKDVDSLSTAACRGAKKAGGMTIGITYGKGLNSTIEKNVDVIIATGMERGGGREFVLALSCDVIIALNGGSGTLNEMVVAYQASIPLITIQGTGGWSEEMADKYFDARKKVKVLVAKNAKDAVRMALLTVSQNEYDLTITRPSGNDTGLIKGIVSPELKKQLNDAVEKKYTNVEQVGFYEFDEKKNVGRLEMAGGEFCGNATRSTAYILLDGKVGEITMRVSGVTRPLLAGIKKENTAFTEIPIMKEFSSVTQLSPKVTKVEIEGITHLITKRPTGTPEELKQKAKKLLKKFDLLTTRKCSGVMYLSVKDNQIVMDPIVWIRDINTLYYETACASGATAVGVWKASQNNEKQTNLALMQPSGENLFVTVNKTKKQFVSAFIEGSLTILKKEEFTYV